MHRDRTQCGVADRQGDVEAASQPLEPAGDIHRVTDDGLLPTGRTEGYHAVVHANADRHGRLAIALLGRRRGAPWPAALASSIAGLLGLGAGPDEGDILDLRPARRADRSAIDSRRRHAVIEQPIEPRVTVQDGVPARFIAIEEV